MNSNKIGVFPEVLKHQQSKYEKLNRLETMQMLANLKQNCYLLIKLFICHLILL